MQSLEELLEVAEPLIHRLASRYSPSIRRSEVSDIKQEFALHLARKFKKNIESKESKPVNLSWVRIVLKKKAIDLWRANQSKKRCKIWLESTMAHSGSNKNVIALFPSNAKTAHDQIEQLESDSFFERLHTAITAVLNVRERIVFNAIANGCTLTQFVDEVYPNISGRKRKAEVHKIRRILVSARAKAKSVLRMFQDELALY